MGRVKVTKKTDAFKKPRFISFEGGDGAGKTTQIQLLNKKLLSVGIKTYVTREPGGSIGAEEIRSLIVEGEPDRWDPYTETLLHFAARRDHLTKAITPALEKGLWVLCDRFIDSTMAYQGYGHGVSKSIINSLCKFVVGDMKPHITIILDIPVKIGLERASIRMNDLSDERNKITQEDRYEKMNTDYHKRLRYGFLEIAEKNPERCYVVNANLSSEEVNYEIERILLTKLGVQFNGV